MAKKFVPTPEQLELILTRYKETKNYTLVSRETGLSVAIVKRIISENTTTETNTTTKTNTTAPTKTAAKPKTTAQLLAAKNEYKYNGLPPTETSLPSKAAYYGQLVTLMKEQLNV